MKRARHRERLVNDFRQIFPASADSVLHYAAAPGRVNLLGEHTDYNDGFVLPMAIQHEVNVVASVRQDRHIHIHSLNFGETVKIDLDRLDDPAEKKWAEYVRGVLWVLKDVGYDPVGMNAVVYGDVPPGAGLSSSAALEIATLLAISSVSGFDVDPPQAAKLAQRAENEIVGVQCGIMDQFASRIGRGDAALLLDCRSLDYELIPFTDPDLSILITHSNVRRGLVDSEYNKRRQECEEGARLLGVKALRDVSSEELAALSNQLPEIVHKRCRHVVEENERVLKAVDNLRSDDYVAFGEAMNASHTSLRDLYEVSCPELDALVEIAQAVDGVLGSRMTGAGFGGCTVTLVRKEALPQLERAISDEYPKRTGLTPKLYVLDMQSAGAYSAVVKNDRSA